MQRADTATVRRSGSSCCRVIVLVGLAVILAEFGLIAGLLAQRRRTQAVESSLRRTEARNSAILRAMPDLMFVLSPDGIYMDYHAPNPKALFVPPERMQNRTPA